MIRSPYFVLILMVLFNIENSKSATTESLCDNPNITSALMLKNNEVWFIRTDLYWIGHGLPAMDDSFATGPHRLSKRLVYPTTFSHKTGDFWNVILTTIDGYSIGNLYVFRKGGTDYWWRWDHVGTSRETMTEDGRARPGLSGLWPGNIFRYRSNVYDQCFHNNDEKWPRAICINNDKKAIHYYKTGYWHWNDAKAIEKGDIFKLKAKLPVRAGFVDHLKNVYLFDFNGKVHQRRLNDTNAAWTSKNATDFFGCSRGVGPTGSTVDDDTPATEDIITEEATGTPPTGPPPTKQDIDPLPIEVTTGRNKAEIVRGTFKWVLFVFIAAIAIKIFI